MHEMVQELLCRHVDTRSLPRERRQQAVEQQREVDVEEVCRGGAVGLEEQQRLWEAQEVAKTRSQEEAAWGRTVEAAEAVQRRKGTSRPPRPSLIADKDEDDSVLPFVSPSRKPETPATATAAAAAIFTKPTVARKATEESLFELPVYYGHAGPGCPSSGASVLTAGGDGAVWTHNCGTYTKLSVGAGFFNCNTCAGDSNGGGLDDLVVSSPVGRYAQLMHRLDRKFVLYGSRGPWPPFAMSLESVDCPSLLLFNMPAGFQVHSEFIKEFFRHAVGSAGDDGFDDLLIRSRSSP
eukprot:m51a1_g13615 hypothetical protein (294) ;mRNA; f:692-2082